MKGTIFDIGEKAGSWFDMDGGGRVQLKTPTVNEWRKIEKATVIKGAPEYPKLDGKHVRFESESIDEDLRLEMLWDITIVSWENFNDANGKEIPCTSEMKVTLMFLDDPTFRDFYNEKMGVLREAEENEAKVTEKNL